MKISILLCAGWLPFLVVAAPSALASAAPRAQAVQLNPDALVLPTVPAEAAWPLRDFAATAAAQVRATYLADAANAADLAASEARLNGDPQLAELRWTWGPILSSARSRAEMLALLAPSLQALAAATVQAQAHRDGSLGPLDLDACGRAFGHSAASTPAAASFRVRAGHLPHRPLGEWQRMCGQARWQKLGGRELAGRRVGPRLEAWAQKHRTLARLVGGRLVRLHRVGGGKVQRYEAGIVRQVGPGGEPCALARLVGPAYHAAGWRLLGRPQPMLCQKMLVPARFR